MALPEHQDRGLFGLFDKKKEEEKKHEDETQNEAQTEAASYYPTPPQHGVEHCQGHGHEGQLTPEEAEQNKHAGLGLFGKKEHEEGKHEDENTDNEAQAETASYYPTPPQHGVEHGHGHEGQLTPEEAEQQKHAGFLGKLHRTHSSSSNSSGDEEEEEEGRKKKDAKDKTKEKLPGDGQHSSCQCAGEEEKKAGPVDKIKEKLPGHPNKKEEEEEEVEKKAGLLDKIKEKLPGHPNKKEEEDEEKLPGHPNKKEEEEEVEKKAGLLDKIKEKLPGHHNKKEGEVEENP